jgi:hypothetical protein
MSTSSGESTEYDWDKIALSVIKALLGRRLTWPLMKAVDAYPVNRDLITGRPVQQVLTVTVMPSGKVLDADDYELASGFRLRIKSSVPLPGCGAGSSFRGPTFPAIPSRSPHEIYVEYVYGSPPPLAVQRAIDYYADQLRLGAANDSTCKLPKRVTSIQREGMSLTLLDPQDFLEKGRTGLPDVDSVLSAFNRGGAKSRARIFTDRNPPARRLSVVPIIDEETS